MRDLSTVNATESARRVERYPSRVRRAATAIALFVVVPGFLTAGQIRRESAAEAYQAALEHKRVGNAAEALAAFEDAVRLAPYEPTLRYQLGLAYQAAWRARDAQLQFREAWRRNGLHRAALERLVTVGAPDSDVARYQQALNRVRTVVETPVDDANWEQCRFSAPARAEDEIQAPNARSPVLLRDSTAINRLDAVHGMRAAAADVDRRGTSQCLVADGHGQILRLKLASKAPPFTVLHQLDERLGPVQQLLVADIMPTPVSADAAPIAPNPQTQQSTEDEIKALRAAAITDGDCIVLCERGTALLIRTADGRFVDASERAGFGPATGRGTLADVDHDGDVDLVLANADGIAIWQNNADGSFADVTASYDLAIDGAANDVVVIDLDGNGTRDIIVATDAGTRVLERNGNGQYSAPTVPAGAWPAARRILANDFTNDGRADVVLVTEDGIVHIDPHGGVRAQITCRGIVPALVTPLDLDGDGWLDLVGWFTKGGPFRLCAWRSSGPVRWHVDLDVNGTREVATFQRPPRAAVLCDVALSPMDNLLVLDATGGTHLLWPASTNRVAFPALPGPSWNRNAIGAIVTGTRGDHRVSRFVNGPRVKLGAASHRLLDLAVIWPDGRLDNQTDWSGSVIMTAFLARLHPRPTGLYVFDAHARSTESFATDILVGARLGELDAAGAPRTPDSEELVALGDLQTREGGFELLISAEFAGVSYLDQARLLVVDHPANVEVHTNDQLQPPPYPRSKLETIGQPTRLQASRSSDGRDRTAALREMDKVYAPPGAALPLPASGVTQPLAIELDFGVIDRSRSLVLALTGSYFPPTADDTASFRQRRDRNTPGALARSTPIRLESLDAYDRWRPVDASIGLPAGRDKTVIVDLAGKLAVGATKLRLTCANEVHWDRIALAERVPPSTRIRAAKLENAKLEHRGYSSTHEGTPMFYSTGSNERFQRQVGGWYTRYGNVDELVRNRDERLLVMRGGDGLTLRFTADLPPTADGHRRSFFLYTFGWTKHAHHHVRDGDQVAPLPVQSDATATGNDWQLRYNTRWHQR